MAKNRKQQDDNNNQPTKKNTKQTEEKTRRKTKITHQVLGIWSTTPPVRLCPQAEIRRRKNLNQETKENGRRFQRKEEEGNVFKFPNS